VLKKDILVPILVEKGMPIALVRILQEYLSDRMGFVQVGNGISCVRDIRTGCIQGSIIGPILFNIYMSNLEKVIHPHRLVCYADDSYVVVSSKDSVGLMNELNEVTSKHLEWLESIGMVCNFSKTELITFGVRDLKFKIGNDEVNSKSCMKILGLLFDDRLTWEDHILATIRKCKSHLFALRYIRTFLTVNDTCKVFNAHLVSILTYGSPVWSHALSYNLRSKVKSIYFLALRTILRDFDLKLNRSQLLRQSGCDGIDTILFLRTSMFIFKTLKLLTPTNLAGEFLCKSYLNERHPGVLTFFDCSRSRFGKKCISNVIKNYTENWNFDWLELTAYSFKNRLKQQFQNQN